MNEGERIKVLIAKPGLDGHDRGAKVVAQALKEAGMEVIYTGLHKTIDQIIRIAIQEDVDCIGLSIMTGAHIPITKKLFDKLREEKLDKIKVFVGGVIPSRFPQFSDVLISKFVTNPWSATKNYYNPPLGASDGEKETLKNQVHTAVLNEWNQGRGIVMYTGHASIHQWAAERVFHLDDVASLNNYGRLPVVLQMTCFTGSFHMPFWDTMDEGLLRRANGGAVATWGPTGLGVATGHDALADGFLETVISNNTPQLGRATMAGKLNLMAHSPGNVDLIDTFTLLGDPATRYDFDFWPGYGTFLPVVLKN